MASVFGSLSKSFDSMVKTNGFLNNNYVATILFMFTAVYAAFVAPQLPNYIRDLFNNPLFRLAFLFLILAVGETRRGSPAAAFIVAVVFMITMAAVNYAIPQKSEFTNMKEGCKLTGKC